jgi:hypothetical protein
MRKFLFWLASRKRLVVLIVCGLWTPRSHGPSFATRMSQLSIEPCTDDTQWNPRPILCFIRSAVLVSILRSPDLKARSWSVFITDTGKFMTCTFYFAEFVTIACILHRILLGWLNQGGWGGRNMWHAWGRWEVFTGFWLGGPKARDHCEDLGVDGRITLSWTLGRKESMVRTGFSWLRIASSGGLVWTRWWTFGFHKKGYFWQAEWQSAFQIISGTMKWVSE